MVQAYRSAGETIIRSVSSALSLLSRKRVCQAGNPVDQIIEVKRFEHMIVGACGATAFQIDCFSTH
jgi:hypothetical protein